MVDIPLYFPSPYTMTEIIFKDDKGSWPQTESFCQESRLNGFSIGYFCREGEKSGTGFVVNVESDQNSLKIGTVLTAAHVFYNNFVFEEDSVDFVLGPVTFEAKPIIREFNWEDDAAFLTDPITQEKISIPEDWILCELLRKGNEIVPKLVAISPYKETSLSCGTEIFVIGYPIKVTRDNLFYAAPDSDSKDLNLVQNSIHNGRKLIISCGKIVKIGEMIAISCATVNGCSGSPILVESNGELKFIGLLYGGPASFLHREVALLIHNSLSPRLKEFIDKFYKRVKSYKSKKKSQGFRNNIAICDLLNQLKKRKKIIDKNLVIPENDLRDTFERYYRSALKIEVSYGFKPAYNLCYPLEKISLD